jgi:3-oxoacyl-[acyl-carrier protein] reductase
VKCAGKVAVVTGGSRGIGQAIATAFARAGARVALWDIDPAAGGKAAAAITATGRQALALTVDVSLASEVRAATQQTLERWGQIDILVNNAGICQVSPIETLSEADWDRVMAVNVKGTFLCSQAVMGLMKTQKSGTIINLGSVAGKLGGIAAGAHYSASKAAVMCFTKSLARELAPFGIRVNAIAPGVIETDMTCDITGGEWSDYLATIPLGRLGRVEEVAAVTVFLASEAAGYLTGEIIDVNGGQLMD